MAEFIGLVNDDWSLPFPNTDTIDAGNLRYTYDACRRTLFLYQIGSKGNPINVSPNRSIHFPEQVIRHMGLVPDRRFYYDYALRCKSIPIRIKNDSACCRCGDYSLSAQRFISSFGDEHGTCSDCTADMFLEILMYEDIPDTLTDDEVREADRRIAMMREADRLEEQRNGTLTRLKSRIPV